LNFSRWNATPPLPPLPLMTLKERVSMKFEPSCLRFQSDLALDLSEVSRLGDVVEVEEDEVEERRIEMKAGLVIG